MTDAFLLFDFDGVIADSFPLASSLALKYCAQNTIESYRTSFEGNIHIETEKQKEEASFATHGPECNHDMDWWGEYEQGMRSVAIPAGMDEVVRALAARYRLAIITSSKAAYIREFLARFGLADAFEDILDVDVHTHKTKKIELLFERHGNTAADYLFITDTLGDIREAREHAVASIACTWGFHPRATLEKGEPFRIVDTPQDIPGAVDDYFARR
jgi:phosphoglycolate phosphatase-like HAD superfamily hydrolase